MTTLTIFSKAAAPGRAWLLAALLCVLPLAAGCDSSGGEEEPVIPALRVTTVTEGTDLDADGYTVMIDGVQEVTIGANQTVTLSQVTSGSHQLALDGVDANCAAESTTLSVTVIGPTEATFTVQCGLKGRIAFMCGGVIGTGGTLCMTRPDGSERIELPFRRSVGFTAFSPDGAKIVYSTGPQYTLLWTYYLDGSPEAPIEFDVVPSEAGDYIPIEPGQPSWSRDGAKIAFSANAMDWLTGAPVGERDIYIMDPDGSNVVNLTNSDSLWYHGPSWSPDGTQLAFMGFAPPQDPPIVEASFGDIYVINADGTNLRNITAGTPQASLVGYANVAPQWSPVDNRIVFSAAPAIGQRWGTWNVYMIDSNGANLQLVTEQAYFASWRPDGEWIVFTWLNGGPGCNIEQLAVMRPDGSEKQPVSEECPEIAEQRASWTLGEGL